MGPLVPDIISPSLNFIVAIVIGIAFGAILEQAGFSTSKKLVGLFYGYDFTVLRVFFTAGVTAMGGVIVLDHFGLLDIQLIYINPTFIWSALVGGVVMGLGFVIGGFCPGTSVCAAAIGKIDAMLFVAGSFLGVFVFSEGYPFFEELYTSGNWGNPQLFETLGMSRGVFALALTLVALVAFWAVSIVEARVNGRKPVLFVTRGVPVLVGAFGLVIALSGFMLPDRRESIARDVADPVVVAGYDIPAMTVDEFAFRLLDRDPKLMVVDFRSARQSEGRRLPQSTAFTYENLFEKEPASLLDMRRRTYVFVADDEADARRMAVAAKELGYRSIEVLEGGFRTLDAEILRFDPASPAAQALPADTQRFRARAHRELPVLMAASASAGPVKKKLKRAIGGC